MTQDKHEDVEFGVSKTIERVVNVETTILIKVNIINMVYKDQFQTFKGDIQVEFQTFEGDIQVDLINNLESIRGNL